MKLQANYPEQTCEGTGRQNVCFTGLSTTGRVAMAKHYNLAGSSEQFWHEVGEIDS